MSKPTWRIVTDASCDISNRPHPWIDYVRVPLTIQIDDQSIESETLTYESLHAQLTQAKNTGTAAPSIGQFTNVFTGVDNVLYLSITGQLSGTYNSAVNAKNVLEDEGTKTKIMLYDTKSASAEINQLVEHAFHLIEEEPTISRQTLLTKLADYQDTITMNAMLTGITNLTKSGRLPKVVGGVIGALNIKLMIGRTPEGTISLGAKLRGTKKLVNGLYQTMVKNGYTGGTVHITHSDDLQSAKDLEETIKQHNPDAKVNMYLSSNLVQFYLEEGGLILSYDVTK